MAALVVDATPYAVARSYTTLLDTTERLGIDTSDAFSRLRHYARSHNERLTEVAQKFLDGALDPMKS